MKNTFAAALLATTLFTTAAGTANAQEGNLVYSRRLNRSIGITPAANAIGASYSVVDAAGKTVVSGKISNGSTFFLSTSRLKSGSYQFVIGGDNAQSFTIK